jgi:hypothetical protein
VRQVTVFISTRDGVDCPTCGAHPLCGTVLLPHRFGSYVTKFESCRASIFSCDMSASCDVSSSVCCLCIMVICFCASPHSVSDVTCAFRSTMVVSNTVIRCYCSAIIVAFDDTNSPQPSVFTKSASVWTKFRFCFCKNN